MARIVVLMVILVLTSLGTGAADDRFYLELRGSLVGLSDIDHNDTASGEHLESDYFPGYGIGGAFGYIIQRRFRLEAELYYRRTPAGEFTLGGVDVGAPSMWTRWPSWRTGSSTFRPVLNGHLMLGLAWGGPSSRTTSMPSAAASPILPSLMTRTVFSPINSWRASPTR